MDAEPVGDFVFTAHALSEMSRRGLSVELVASILAAPEQRCEVRPGRVVLQALAPMGIPCVTYLVRVFVDVDRTPAEVVTAYRTSRIAKYWSQTE
jgi:hypothetical protein